MFSEKLKQAMDEKGMNLTALSKASGIGKSSISQYLSGKNEPTDKRKEVLAIALGLSADYFKGASADNIRGVPSLSVQTAAKLMHKSKGFIYEGLQNGRFPWGWAVLMSSGEWNYYISPIKFTEYTGIEVP